MACPLRLMRLPNCVAEKLEYRVAAKDDGTEFVIMDMATGQEWIG